MLFLFRDLFARSHFPPGTATAGPEKEVYIASPALSPGAFGSRRALAWRMIETV
jgi:hypothetical protein